MTPPTPEPTPQATLLYIEDDVANRNLVAFMMEQRPHINLIMAENGFQGIDMASDIQPQMILLDLSLPDISGFEVLQTLLAVEATQEIPVVALSGDNTFTDIEKGLAAGFNAYLTKPINVTDFFSTLDAIIPKR